MWEMSHLYSVLGLYEYVDRPIQNTSVKDDGSVIMLFTISAKYYTPRIHTCLSSGSSAAPRQHTISPSPAPPSHQIFSGWRVALVCVKAQQ